MAIAILLNGTTNLEGGAIGYLVWSLLEAYTKEGTMLGEVNSERLQRM